MEKTDVRADAAKCVACMACQLICSLTYIGSLNPEKSCILINPPYEIHFTEECKRGCILCANYCDFGAITRVKKE